MDKKQVFAYSGQEQRKWETISHLKHMNFQSLLASSIIQLEGAAYLQMKIYGVNFNYNDVYINDNKVLYLDLNGNRWGFAAILVGVQQLRKGQNTLKITLRNNSGDTSGDIDDYVVRDPILVYPIE